MPAAKAASGGAGRHRARALSPALSALSALGGECALGGEGGRGAGEVGPASASSPVHTVRDSDETREETCVEVCAPAHARV